MKRIQRPWFGAPCAAIRRTTTFAPVARHADWGLHHTDGARGHGLGAFQPTPVWIQTGAPGVRGRWDRGCWKSQIP